MKSIEKLVNQPYTSSVISVETNQLFPYLSRYLPYTSLLKIFSRENISSLNKEEQELMDKLTLSFRHCDRLQRHIDFLFSHGSMYLDYNYNLLFHGCIPTLDDGSFQTFITKDNKIIKGKEYLDYLDKEMRKAYYSKKIDKDTSIFYFLWCSIKHCII